MIRILFHGGTREKNADGSVRNTGIAHNSAFYFAAQNVVKDYKNGEKHSIKITTAADMVRGFNSLMQRVVQFRTLPDSAFCIQGIFLDGYST
jgi:hypothetical protein